MQGNFIYFLVFTVLTLYFCTVLCYNVKAKKYFRIIRLTADWSNNNDRQNQI